MLDIITTGSMMVDFSPGEAGASLRDGRNWLRYPSGSMVIFAYAAARLGKKVGIISAVGDDTLGRWMIDELAAAGVDTEQVELITGQLTPLALVAVDRDGNKEYAFYRFPGYSNPGALITPFDMKPGPEYIAAASIFDFTEASIRDNMLRQNAFYAAKVARQAGRQICYCANYRASAWSKGADEAVAVTQEAIGYADILIMNEVEAMLLGGEASADVAAARLAALGPQIVTITQGERGATLYDHGIITYLPAYDVQVVYDIGAGDTFHAGLLCGLLSGFSAQSATRYAAAAAALKISRGADLALLPTHDEVMQLVQEVK